MRNIISYIFLVYPLIYFKSAIIYNSNECVPSKHPILILIYSENDALSFYIP
ncbi:hypothetical protein D088_900072 [Salmonella enterica subsp. houtenae serovar 16:z4,z32:-- str. RKS3027]|nr:hypothetical protein D088_900072 [Salmonella enterica subsp. houtenae serovar 16:z4,z32:-- str. RKS3027]